MLTKHSSHPSGVNCTAVDAVMRCSQSKGGSRLVLLAIARFINPQDREAWPSNTTLSELTRMPERSIRRCVDTLIKSGELEREIQDSAWDTNVYRLPMLYGWVQASSKLLDSDIHRIEDDRDSYISTRKYISRSSTDDASPPQQARWEEMVLSLSYEFADLLIAAGRKNARYRADAASEQWRNEMDYLLAERLVPDGRNTLEGVLQRIRHVMAHAAAGPLRNGMAIKEATDLRDRWQDIEDDLEQTRREAEQDTPSPHQTDGPAVTFPRDLERLVPELADQMKRHGAEAR